MFCGQNEASTVLAEPASFPAYLSLTFTKASPPHAKPGLPSEFYNPLLLFRTQNTKHKLLFLLGLHHIVLQIY